MRATIAMRDAGPLSPWAISRSGTRVGGRAQVDMSVVSSKTCPPSTHLRARFPPFRVLVGARKEDGRGTNLRRLSGICTSAGGT